MIGFANLIHIDFLKFLSALPDVFNVHQFRFFTQSIFEGNKENGRCGGLMVSVVDS